MLKKKYYYKFSRALLFCIMTTISDVNNNLTRRASLRLQLVCRLLNQQIIFTDLIKSGDTLSDCCCDYIIEKDDRQHLRLNNQNP